MELCSSALLFLVCKFLLRHFDDFTWGDTRKIEGEIKQGDHSNREGKYEIGAVQLKTWEEWEIRRRLKEKTSMNHNNASFSRYGHLNHAQNAVDTPGASQETVRYGRQGINERDISLRALSKKILHTPRPQQEAQSMNQNYKSPDVSQVTNINRPPLSPQVSYSFERGFDVPSSHAEYWKFVIPKHDGVIMMSPIQPNLNNITSYISDSDSDDATSVRNSNLDQQKKSFDSKRQSVPLLTKPSLASFATNISSSINSGVEPNATKSSTINQFWKELYLVQQDSITHEHSDNSILHNHSFASGTSQKDSVLDSAHQVNTSRNHFGDLNTQSYNILPDYKVPNSKAGNTRASDLKFEAYVQEPTLPHIDLGSESLAAHFSEYLYPQSASRLPIEIIPSLNPDARQAQKSKLWDSALTITQDKVYDLPALSGTQLPSNQSKLKPFNEPLSSNQSGFQPSNEPLLLRMQSSNGNQLSPSQSKLQSLNEPISLIHSKLQPPSDIKSQSIISFSSSRSSVNGPRPAPFDLQGLNEESLKLPMNKNLKSVKTSTFKKVFKGSQAKTSTLMKNNPSKTSTFKKSNPSKTTILKKNNPSKTTAESKTSSVKEAFRKAFHMSGAWSKEENVNVVKGPRPMPFP